MPTGYTAALEKKNYDVGAWLKEDVIRAMGVCVVLRGDGPLTLQEIEARLASEYSGQYHEGKLKTVADELQRAMQKTPGDWEREYIAECRRIETENAHRQAEFDRKSAAHLSAVEQVGALYGAGAHGNEVISGTLKFALEQLESAYKFDYGHGPYLAPVPTSIERYRDQTIAKLTKDAAYHQEHLTKDRERARDRLEGYRAFVKFVDEHAKETGK